MDLQSANFPLQPLYLLEMHKKKKEREIKRELILPWKRPTQDTQYTKNSKLETIDPV